MATTDATLTNSANLVVFEGTITGDIGGVPRGWTEDTSDPANVATNGGTLTADDGTNGASITPSEIDVASDATAEQYRIGVGVGFVSKPLAGTPGFSARSAGGATVALDGDGLLVENVVLGASLAYASTAAAAPTTFTTPIYYDSTAVTGGLYAWDGSAYIQIGGLIA